MTPRTRCRRVRRWLGRLARVAAGTVIGLAVAGAAVLGAL